jgi:uncharacterized membrane protein YdjX (TVP38/TMEM64 family)
MRSWATILAVVFGVILVPFLLFGQASESRIEGWLDVDGSRATVAVVIVGALTLDVFLPVPSSVVSTAAGALLGLWLGAVVSTVGMMLGCILGYWAGGQFGTPLVSRIVDRRDLEDVQAQFRRNAGWTLTLTRPLPVLAEASVLLAGLSALPVARFLVITSLANAGISTLYAMAGAKAREGPWFLLAVFASCALPAAAFVIRRGRPRPLGRFLHRPGG